MTKDREQLTPEDPEDWAKLQKNRGQGTGGTGYDRLLGEEAPGSIRDESPAEEVVPDPLPENP